MTKRDGGRFGMATYIVAAVAVAILIGGVSWWVRGAGSRDGGGAAWQVEPEAFESTDSWMAGPRLVLADPAGCFSAYGQRSTGYGMVPGYWTATGDCTTPMNMTPTRRPIGDGLPSEDRASFLAAVPAHDGGYLAVSRYTYHGDAYAYTTTVLKGDPSAGFTRVAEFGTDPGRDSHIGPEALVATENGYVAVGHRDGEAIAWTSTDGARWEALGLSAQGTSALALTAGPDGRVVAVGVDRRVPTAWTSTDAGATWTIARMPEAGDGPQLWSVIHNGQEYVALGGVDGNLRGGALVYTSPDGMQWTRREVPSDVHLLRTAVVLPDGSVLTVAADGSRAERPDEQCALAWRWDGTTWTSEDLGCHGVPESLAVLSDGRVAGVHWGALFLRAADPTTD